MTVSPVLSATAIEADLLAFLAMRTKIEWAPDADLFVSEVVNSLFAMELVVYLETTFDIAIAGVDLRLDNFRTVRSMVALVTRLSETDAGTSGA